MSKLMQREGSSREVGGVVLEQFQGSPVGQPAPQGGRSISFTATTGSALRSVRNTGPDNSRAVPVCQATTSPAPPLRGTRQGLAPARYRGYRG